MLELNKLTTPKAIDKLKQKGFDFDQEKFLKLYNLKRELKQKIDDLRNQKNKIAKKMANNFDKNLINQGKELNKEIKDNELLFKDIETELTDSVTGEVLGAAIKQGFGEKLDDSEQALTLDNVKPLIDNWATTMKSTLTEILK